MAQLEINESRVRLMQQISIIVANDYLADSNRTNLDIVLSLYLEFDQLNIDAPKCIEDIVKSSIKSGNVVKTLKVKRGRELDLDQQFNILMCLLIIQTLEGKSQLNKYNINGLSIDECIEKASKDCKTSISNIFKCKNKYGNAFKSHILSSDVEISFIFNKDTKEESKVILKTPEEPISDMIQEAIDILF